MSTYGSIQEAPLTTCFHLLMSTDDRVPKLAPTREAIHSFAKNKLEEHKRYIQEHGEDMPEIRDWKWTYN